MWLDKKVAGSREGLAYLIAHMATLEAQLSKRFAVAGGPADAAQCQVSKGMMLDVQAAETYCPSAAVENSC